jgi:hypothetical protein
VLTGAQLEFDALSEHWNEDGAMVAAKHATSMSDDGVERFQQVFLKKTVQDSATAVAKNASKPKQKPRGRSYQTQPADRKRDLADRAYMWMDAAHYPFSAFNDGKAWSTRSLESFLPVEGSLQHIGLETTGNTARSYFLITDLGEYVNEHMFASGEIYCMHDRLHRSAKDGISSHSYSQPDAWDIDFRVLQTPLTRYSQDLGRRSREAPATQSRCVDPRC